MTVIHEKYNYLKTYSLNISRQGEVVVKTNRLCTKEDLNLILKKHKIWISKRLQEFEKIKTISTSENKFEIEDNSTLNLLGKDYIVRFVLSNKTQKPKVYFDLNSLIVCYPSGYPLTQANIKKLVSYFLKRSSKDLFIEKTNYYANKYGLEFNKISIKNQRSKWGSCSSKKNLNFNWKLILFPENVLDYVVIHEVCHLKEMNHSKRFWDLVKIECPDYKNRRKWLRTNGELLNRVFS